ncbi:MAG: patatin-like phospholipase family protein, partial [Anaerolineaceae bacterium]|nr:patatin-like phospholipase family protein [Anaerolineaceae bacterium]
MKTSDLMSLWKKGGHDERNSKWGLVLSGGGTKGAYEVGVWKALRELHIPIRGIAGTSIGALNAAMFLCLEQKQIEEIYRNIRLSDVLPVSGKIDPDKDVFDPSNLLAIIREFFLQRGLDNAQLRNMLETHLDIDRIYKSPLDLGIVTYNIPTKEAFQLFKEDIERDKLIDYLLASANFPIYKTQNVDGKHFLDGGLYDNMPFNLLI